MVQGCNVSSKKVSILFKNARHPDRLPAGRSAELAELRLGPGHER